jgi:hypothetical protein
MQHGRVPVRKHFTVPVPVMPPRRKATPSAQRWIRVLLSLGVGVAVGLAPWLGKSNVPGFSALLSLYPPSLQSQAIPLASFLTGVVGAFVQFFDGPRTGARNASSAFVITGIGCVVMLLLLTQIYKESVTLVTYPGDNLRVAYTTGFGQRPATCCPGTPPISDEECITGIGNPVFVKSCFGDTRVRHAEEALLYVYLFTMTFFGVLVGLLVLKPTRGKGS